MPCCAEYYILHNRNWYIFWLGCDAVVWIWNQALPFRFSLNRRQKCPKTSPKIWTINVKLWSNPYLCGDLWLLFENKKHCHYSKKKSKIIDWICFNKSAFFLYSALQFSSNISFYSLNILIAATTWQDAVDLLFFSSSKTRIAYLSIFV